MSVGLAVLVFLLGLGIVLFSAEQMVKGVVGTSLSVGVSAFVLTVVLVGFDPDNLSVGAVASFEGAAGLAWGSIVGAAMVAVALAFGVTALFAPMTFGAVPRRILVLPPAAVVLLGGLGIDGRLSRLDGAVLVACYALSVLWLFHLSRQGLDIRPTGEVKEVLEKDQPGGRFGAVARLLLSLAGIVIGSEMLISAAGPMLDRLGMTETAFGMTILALLVSIEELARELPPALKGRPEISYANVLGSVLAMFLFNAGAIALVRPLPVTAGVFDFSLPYALATVLILSIIMATGRVPRWAGALLVLLYAGFAAGIHLRG